MVSAWEDAFALLEAHGDIQEAGQALFKCLRAVPVGLPDQILHLEAVATCLGEILDADQPVQ